MHRDSRVGRRGRGFLLVSEPSLSLAWAAWLWSAPGRQRPL